MKFHHIGICCKNIKEEIENIKKIHQVKSVSKVIYDKKQEAELCILEIEDGLKIELIAEKQVENLLKKKITYYHICYEVENITKEKEKLIKNGAFLLSDEKEAVLFSNRKVCFLMTSYGMIELLEK
ncbi:VOC family protein [Fusobacterium varium]|uniref:VOC family protein n=1 Tax=Fusobacterium varium TaxID=856 RepID=UPI001F449269|nr:VOC family protein [Fusobacterium varium]MCF2674687.1 VOC family protein [Fusobacterium varium]